MENETMLTDTAAEETEIAEEPATDLDEDIETEEDVDIDDETDDDELEYDDDGNIIIPDDDPDGEADEDGDAQDEVEKATPAKKADEAEKPADESLDMENKYKKLEAQIRTTLKSMGEDIKDGEDTMRGLARIAAETEGISTEEYLRKKSEADELESARALLKSMKYEKMAVADLAVLHSEYPETQSIKKLKDLPAEVLSKFGRYRDMGLGAKEAYAAANPDGIRSSVAASAKQQAANNGKAHLRSAVPKGAADHSTRLTKAEMSIMRQVFPDKSDKEIISLYKKTKEN